VDDMTRWPAVEYVTSSAIIYTTTRSTYKAVIATMDVFNYFQSGFGLSCSTTSNSCIVMAYVNPSQNAPEKAHLAWVGTKLDGEIITLHCTCMAG